MGRGRTLRPVDHMLDGDDWLKEQVRLAADEYRAEEERRRQDRAHTRGARSVTRTIAAIGLAILIVSIVLTIGSALALSAEPSADVLVSEAVVKAQQNAQPDLEDDIKGSSSGAIAQPTTSAGDESPPPSALPALADFIHHIERVGGGETHRGTCVSLGGGYFLTAAHVVERGGYVRIDGKGVSAQITRAPGGHDVALVKTDLVLPGAEFQATWTAHRASLTVVGFPGLEPQARVCQGILGDFDLAALEGDGNAVTDGMSGGGVFASGRLVGILRGYTSGNGVPPNPLAARFTPLAQVATLLAPLRPADETAPSLPAADAGGDARPIVYVDTPAGDWCAPCRALKASDWSARPYQLVFRSVDDNRHQSYPHVHVVNAAGQEVCAGVLATLDQIEAAFHRLH